MSGHVAVGHNSISIFVMPSSPLRQLLKFIRVFGLMSGVRLWTELTWQRRGRRSLLTLKVPGLAGPLHLRRRDLAIFWQIMVMRENDFGNLPQTTRIQESYKSILGEGNRPVVIDCGGHVGLSALWFASRFPEAQVYSIEPDAENFELLQTNARVYSQIVPLRGGVWSRSCDLEIRNPSSGSASFQLQEVHASGSEAGSESGPGVLRGYTIDEIFRSEAKNRLFLVKIDVEGAEAELFQGPTEWMDDTTTVVIELHDWLLPGQGTSRSFFKRLSERSFDVVLRGENLLLFRV